MKATRHDPFALGDKTRWFFTAAALFLAAPPATLRGESIAYSQGDPTNLEQYQLELVNAARANPGGEALRLGIDLNKDLTPGRISPSPKQPLAFHSLLLQVARGHSDWMLATGNFSHTGLNGSNPTKRAAAKSYNFSVAENIAYLSTSATPDLNSYTINTHENLFKSPSHRPNLMDPSFSVVGLGLREGKFQGLNALMVTQNFSSGGNSTDSGPFLVGVVYKDLNKNGAYDPGEGLPGVRVEPDFGGYHAVTSQSGGYAVPLPPVETRAENVSIPLAVKSTTWADVRPHDEAFRERKIIEAPEITIRVTWSGGALTQAVQNIVKIRKPTRINYKLIGADNFGYNRTMVSSLNVKGDLKVILPSITSQPKNLAVVTTSGARFSVTATGINLTYQWHKNGSAIKGATGPSFNISSVKPTDAGNYTVTIANSAGRVTSTVAMLTVNAPKITSNLSAQTLNLNVFSSRHYTLTTNFAATSYTSSKLPAGLNLNSLTGIISGKPTGKGTHTVTFTAIKQQGTKVIQSATAQKVFKVN
jgi:uncharacterized protein YkwD